MNEEELGDFRTEVEARVNDFFMEPSLAEWSPKEAATWFLKRMQIWVETF